MASASGRLLFPLMIFMKGRPSLAGSAQAALYQQPDPRAKGGADIFLNSQQMRENPPIAKNAEKSAVFLHQIINSAGGGLCGKERIVAPVAFERALGHVIGLLDRSERLAVRRLDRPGKCYILALAPRRADFHPAGNGERIIARLDQHRPTSLLEYLAHGLGEI